MDDACAQAALSGLRPADAVPHTYLGRAWNTHATGKTRVLVYLSNWSATRSWP